MDKFFASLLLLDELALMGIGLVLMIFGGFFGAFSLEPKVPYRRVVYLWFIALLSVALSITQLIWFLTPAAAEAGLISPLILFGGVSTFLFGVGLYYGSAARSLDMNGDTSAAWYGFVPIANLWLVFKGGKAQVEDATSMPRSAFSRLVLDPILIIVAILILGTAQAIDTILEDVPPYSWSDSQALTELLLDIRSSRSVEENFAEEVRLSRPSLPIRLDEITVMVGLEAIGKTLRVTYDVERDIPGFIPEFKQMLAPDQCKMFGFDINRGGIVEMVYRGPDGGIIDTFRIMKGDCAP